MWIDGDVRRVDVLKYDAEDHVLQHFVSQNATTPDVTLTYGPTGLPRTDTTVNGAIESLHWDGDSLLFVTSNSNTVPLTQENIEKLGSISNGSLLVADRDWGGAEVAWHSGTAGSAWNIDQLRTPGSKKFPPVTKGCVAQCTPPGPAVGMGRLDGYALPNSTFVSQGLRVFDTSSDQWLTRDPSPGNAKDALSTQAYMWLMNNPERYMDPIGLAVGDCARWDPIHGCVDPEIAQVTSHAGLQFLNLPFLRFFLATKSAADSVAHRLHPQSITFSVSEVAGAGAQISFSANKCGMVSVSAGPAAGLRGLAPSITADYVISGSGNIRPDLAIQHGGFFGGGVVVTTDNASTILSVGLGTPQLGGAMQSVLYAHRWLPNFANCAK